MDPARREHLLHTLYFWGAALVCLAACLVSPWLPQGFSAGLQLMALPVLLLTAGFGYAEFRIAMGWDDLPPPRADRDVFP